MTHSPEEKEPGVTKERRLLASPVFYLVVYLVFVAYQISPIFQRNQVSDEFKSSAFSKEFRDIARPASDTSHGGAREYYSEFETFPVTQFISGNARLVAVGTKVDVEDRTLTLRPRYDKIILYSAIALIITLAVSTLYRTSRTIVHSGKETQSSSLERETGSSLRDESPEDMLHREVSNAQSRSEDLYLRSTLLLTGGIVMAFVGVGIFYVSLPDIADFKDLSVETYLAGALRPAGVLIFVEAIAWFLLRQYRALIEDYKTFHRMYIKRTNHLICLKALRRLDTPGSELPLVMSLLQEDLSGVLRQGETTEGLEQGLRTRMT